MKAPTAPFLLTLCLAACAPMTPSYEDEASSSDEQDITSADETAAAPQVVHLVVGGATCTATMLTRHWLLTAAHCADHEDGPVIVRWTRKGSDSAEVIYEDDASFFVHPDYAGPGHGDRENDIALVFLDYGAEEEWRGRLYIDEDQPWASSWSGSREFTVIGWGRGTDSGSDAACPGPGTSGTKRRSEGWKLLAATTDAPLSAEATHAGSQLCPGDSGSPWMLERDDKFLTFAVHSGGTTTERATLIGPKRAWLEDIMNEIGNGVTCRSYVAADARYRRCQDK